MGHTRRGFFALAWRTAMLAGLATLLPSPRSAEAAVVRLYIDNRLTTGANNGTSPANAFKSIEDARAALAGGTTDIVEFVAGSGPYQEAFGTRITRYKTDLSFQQSDRSLNSTVTALNTFGFAVNDIVRIGGTTIHKGRQFQIATIAANKITFIASNTVQDEAAGPKVMVTTINNGSNLAGLDPAANGTAARPMRWLMNGVEIDAGLTLDSANGFTWTASSGGSNEWYVRRSDASNPSLLQPFCAVISDEYIADAATSTKDMGTVGALSESSPMGWGDNDTLGYSTVYVKSSVSPQALGIRVGQLAAGVAINWQFHSFEDGVFSLGNRDAGSNSARGCAIANKSTTQWWVKRCVFRWQSSHGVEQATSAGGQTTCDACVSYFSGHRGYALTGDASLTVRNCLDYGAHLFAIIGSAVTGAGRLEITNCVSMYNEAGAIDKKSATAVLVETHNVWFPLFSAPGAALGYITPTNWPTTHATDYPPSAATTISSQAANLAAGAVDPALQNLQLMPGSVDGLRPTAVAMRGTGKSTFFMVGKDGKRFRLSAFDRGPWVMR